MSNPSSRLRYIPSPSEEKLEKIIKYCRVQIKDCNTGRFWGETSEELDMQVAQNEGRERAFREVLDEIGVPYA